jgi:hypothetical protein
MKVFPKRWGPWKCALVGFLLCGGIPTILAETPSTRDVLIFLLGEQPRSPVEHYMYVQNSQRWVKQEMPADVDYRNMSVAGACFGVLGAILGRRAGIRNRDSFRCPKCNSWKIGRESIRFWSLKWSNKCLLCGYIWR